MRAFFKGLLTCPSLALGGLLLLVLLLMVACVSRDGVSRVTSPDGAIKTILIETNSGATTSFGDEVQLRPADSWLGFSSEVAAFYARSAQQMRLRGQPAFDRADHLAAAWSTTCEGASAAEPKCSLTTEAV